LVGQKIEIIRKGSGEVSIAGAVGVTINSKNMNKRIASQYSGAILVKDDTNTWILIGDLKA
jgi:beta-lactamase superfamily II metal-dependent hydrolase